MGEALKYNDGQERRIYEVILGYLQPRNIAFVLSIASTLLAGDKAFSANTDPSVPEAKAQEILEQTLSKELLAQIEKAGFKATLTLKRPDPKEIGKSQKSIYIVHLGQMHESPGLEAKMFYRHLSSKAQEYQRKLSQFLLPLVKQSGHSPVFREGYTNDTILTPDVALRATEKLNKLMDSLEEIKDKKQIEISDIDSIVSAFVKAYDYKKSYRYHPKYIEFIKIFNNTIDHILKTDEHGKNFIGKLNDKVLAIKDKQQRERYRTKLDDLKDVIGLSGLDIISSFIKNESFFYYAVSNAFWKGEISVVGAEDRNVNSEALRYLFAMNKAKEKMSRLESMSKSRKLTEEEQQEYKNLQKVVEDAKYWIYTKRELVVYTKIRSVLQNPKYKSIVNNMKFAVVEYGVGHDFAKSAKQWNAQSEDIKFGIIKIHPIQNNKNGNNSN